MTPREWFILGIRLFGISLLIRGLRYIVSYLDVQLGLGEWDEWSDGNPAVFLLYAAVDLVLAGYFLLAPGNFASWCDQIRAVNKVEDEVENKVEQEPREEV
jgi:hypothetical protein